MTTTDTPIMVSAEEALSELPLAGLIDAENRLRKLRAMYRDATTETATARKRHRDDIETIGERLIEEAKDRDWCSVYDEIIDDLNHKLYVELPVRSRNYTVRVQATVTFEVEVEDQTSESDARETAREWIESDARDYVNYVTRIDVEDTEVI